MAAPNGSDRTPNGNDRTLEPVGWDLDGSAWRELRQIDRLRLLEKGEVLCEIEAAGIGARPGAIVVTDRRVMFVSTGLVLKRTRVHSIPLAEILSTAWDCRRALGREHGVLILTRSGQQDAVTTFDAIRGGLARAEEIARTISRQQGYLEATFPNKSEPNQKSSSVESALEVTLGRGVASYIKEHGGQLFVWGRQVGDFARVTASTEPPEHVNLVRLSNIREFDLYIEESLVGVGRLRLTRKRLPRPGIAVDTGLVAGA